MPWLAIAGYIFKALGFAQWAENMFAAHEAKLKADKEAQETTQRAQAVADIPQTSKERSDAADKGLL